MIESLPRVAIAVRDMDRAIDTFRNAFGMRTHEFAWAAKELGGRMAFATAQAGSHIELVAPSDADRPHSRKFFEFLERRGEGPYAVLLNARDPDAEAEALERRGLPVMPRMAEAGGRDIHPRNTGGVLIRIYPPDLLPRVDRELEEILGPVSARTGAAGLSGIRRVVVVARDLDAAVTVWRDQLGFETVVRPAGRSAIATPPDGAAVELLALSGGEGQVGPIPGERGEGIHALVLESGDLESSVRALRAKGVPLRRSDGDGAAWEIDRDAAFGVLFRLEQGPARPV